jgi:hypothetical protein
MALDGVAAGCFDSRDALRPDAAQAVAALRVAGLRVLMLTGDAAAAAAPIAARRESPRFRPLSIRPANWPTFGLCSNPVCALSWSATA